MKIFRRRGGIFLGIYEHLEKRDKIKKEMNRLKKLFKEFDKAKSKSLEGLIENAAFMRITLDELREDLLVNGTTELFEQGEQTFNRERPEAKQYTTFIQRYSQVMKQLIDLLPSEVKKQEEDALMEFVKRAK